MGVGVCFFVIMYLSVCVSVSVGMCFCVGVCVCVGVYNGLVFRR